MFLFQCIAFCVFRNAFKIVKLTNCLCLCSVSKLAERIAVRVLEVLEDIRERMRLVIVELEVRLQRACADCLVAFT